MDWQPIETAPKDGTERQIVAWLRHLAATAHSDQSKGAYLYAADGVMTGEFRKKVDQW